MLLHRHKKKPTKVVEPEVVKEVKVEVEEPKPKTRKKTTKK